MQTKISMHQHNEMYLENNVDYQTNYQTFIYLNKNLQCNFPQNFLFGICTVASGVSLKTCKTIAPAPHRVVSFDSGWFYRNKCCSVLLFINLFAYKFKIYKWFYRMKLHLKVIYFFSVSLTCSFLVQTHKHKMINHLTKVEVLSIL